MSHGKYGAECSTGYNSEVAARTTAGRPCSHVEQSGHAALILQAHLYPRPRNAMLIDPSENCCVRAFSTRSYGIQFIVS